MPFRMFIEISHFRARLKVRHQNQASRSNVEPSLFFLNDHSLFDEESISRLNESGATVKNTSHLTFSNLLILAACRLHSATSHRDHPPPTSLLKNRHHITNLDFCLTNLSFHTWCLRLLGRQDRMKMSTPHESESET